MSLSVRFLGWTSVKYRIPQPPRFHLSSKPGFCIPPITLNSTKMCWYKGILCVFCPSIQSLSQTWHRAFCGNLKRRARCSFLIRLSEDEQFLAAGLVSALIEVTLPSSSPPSSSSYSARSHAPFRLLRSPACLGVSPLVVPLNSFPLWLLLILSSPFYPNWMTMWLKYSC